MKKKKLNNYSIDYFLKTLLLARFGPTQQEKEIFNETAIAKKEKLFYDNTTYNYSINEIEEELNQCNIELMNENYEPFIRKLLLDAKTQLEHSLWLLKEKIGVKDYDKKHTWREIWETLNINQKTLYELIINHKKW